MGACAFEEEHEQVVGAALDGEDGFGDSLGWLLWLGDVVALGIDPGGGEAAVVDDGFKDVAHRAATGFFFHKVDGLLIGGFAGFGEVGMATGLAACDGGIDTGCLGAAGPVAGQGIGGEESAFPVGLFAGGADDQSVGQIGQRGVLGLLELAGEVGIGVASRQHLFHSGVGQFGGILDVPGAGQVGEELGLPVGGFGDGFGFGVDPGLGEVGAAGTCFAEGVGIDAGSAGGCRHVACGAQVDQEHTLPRLWLPGGCGRVVLHEGQ